MEFVISIRIQAAKTVAAGVIGITASHRIGAHVFQKDNAAREWAVGLVRHHAAHGTELRFALFVLSNANRREKRENYRQPTNASPHAHPLPPVAGSIPNPTLPSSPPPSPPTPLLSSTKP